MTHHGAGAMDPFVARLAELCRSHRTAVKWVLVPSHALGWTLGERLVLGGTPWANLRFTPLFDIALRMAAPFLVERGIEPATDRLGPALVMRLLLDLPASVPAYFRGLGEQPRMAEALWATLGELRMAGLGPGDLRPPAFASPAKHAELVALLGAYEAYLAGEGLADAAAVYREALAHPDVCPVLPGELLVELPGIAWRPLERRLLEALPATRVEVAAPCLPGLAVPRRLASSGTPAGGTAPPPVTTDSSRLAYLMAPGEMPLGGQPGAGAAAAGAGDAADHAAGAADPAGDAAAGTDGTLLLFRAGGREAEVEEVFRRILAAGVALDRVEIACAPDEYPALIWEKAQRHGWPVTVGPGVPITVTRPARALLAFGAWVEEGFPAAGLRRLLQSGAVRVLDGGPSAGQAARLLAASGATWGRQTYAAALAALAASCRQRSGDPEQEEAARARLAQRADHAGRLAAWIEQLLALAPAADAAGRVRLAEVVAGARAFVERVAARASELDGEAAVVLGEALEELGALGDLARPLGQALALVRHRVEQLTAGGDRARPGHLHVAPLREAGRAGRPWTFVVGLEEGRVFPAVVEDPVLLDAERAAISPALPTSGDRAGESLHAVVSRLAVLGGHVTLSFSCHDPRQHREAFPSWLMLQALRVLRPGRDWTYQDLDRALGEPASLVPGRAGAALADDGWWLAGLRGVGRRALPAVHAAFPWLAGGERAEAERDSAVFTPWDGLVPEAAAVLDPRRSGQPVAATVLEGLARCPFRHFLERGLDLRALEEAEPDRDHWLDPATRGHLLHELYAAILREARDRGRPPDPGRDGPRLRRLAEERLAAHRELMPPPSEAVFDRERREILNDLDLFLQLETGQPGRTPVGLEVGFGSRATEGEPLARVEPVTVDLGPGLRFRLAGRIDRIDRVGEGLYEVIDYKTGWWRPAEYEGTFRGGRLLQHALYRLAATELLRPSDPKARVAGSGYALPTVRGRGQRVVKAAEPARLAAVLHDLFEVLAAGAFVHTPDAAEDCRYCEMGPACGPRAAERAGVKLAGADNAVLDPYRRLGRHE